MYSLILLYQGHALDCSADPFPSVDIIPYDPRIHGLQVSTFLLLITFLFPLPPSLAPHFPLTNFVKSLVLPDDRRGLLHSNNVASLYDGEECASVVPAAELLGSLNERESVGSEGPMLVEWHAAMPLRMEVAIATWLKCQVDHCLLRRPFGFSPLTMALKPSAIAVVMSVMTWRCLGFGEKRRTYHNNRDQILHHLRDPARRPPHFVLWIDIACATDESAGSGVAGRLLRVCHCCGHGMSTCTGGLKRA